MTGKYTRYMFVISGQLHASWPSWFLQRAGTFQTWSVCVSFRFLRPKSRRFVPCFLDGKTTSTIPHKYAPRQKQAFEYGCADGSGQGSRRAVTFTRSTPGCGTLAGPSLVFYQNKIEIYQYYRDYIYGIL